MCCTATMTRSGAASSGHEPYWSDRGPAHLGHNVVMSSAIPELGKAYAFVREVFFLSEHNYRCTRRFVGALVAGRAERLPVMLLPDDEPGLVAPFAAAKFDDPVEREGELIRRDEAPNRCSRLGGVFTFVNLDTCRRASSLYGWDLATVRQGRAYGTWSAYDMQIISALRMPGLPSSTRSALWRHYWKGAPGVTFQRWYDLLAEYRGMTSHCGSGLSTGTSSSIPKTAARSRTVLNASDVFPASQTRPSPSTGARPGLG